MNSDIAFWGHTASERLALTAAVQPDGSASVRGAVRLGPAGGTVVALPGPAGGQASCADADGDGVAGLVGLSFAAELVRTGERVPVSIAPLEGDIDSSGTHAVSLTVGDDTRIVSVRAHVR